MKICILLIALAAVAAGLWMVGSGSVKPSLDNPHPADHELEAMFKAHQEEFETLVKMSDVDERVIRIAPDFTWLKTNVNWPRPESEWGISKERWDEYRRLFKVVKLQDGLDRDEKGDRVYFIASSQGLITNGSAKGYAFARVDVNPLVQSLDTPTSWPRDKRVFYKRLSDNWYLFFRS